MIADLRQALHRIRQQPAFALTIVLVLMLGSAAVAVVLAVADAVIVRPLPYPGPGRLAVMWEHGTENQVIEVSLRNYVDWRAQARSFEQIAAFSSINWSQRMTGQGDPATVPGAGVSASFFDVMGVPPQLGRVLLPSDDRPKAAPVAVISHGFWQRRFGGDPHVLGRRITLGGAAFEIVGVMPRGFDFPTGAELWLPVTPRIDASSAGIKTDALEARWFGVLFVIGRLRPEATMDQARQELDAINARIDRLTPRPMPSHLVVTTTLEQRLLGNTRAALLLLLGAVALIVLIACANVATLLLMRAARMQRETAVRLSLGASPRQIGRLWLAEGLALFLIAGVAGLLLADLALPLVIRLAPDSVYRIGEARLTLSVAGVVLAIMAIGAIATAALITALSVRRLRLTDALRDGGSRTTSSRMRLVRRLLVTAEVAVACVLLVGAGLTIRSFMNLRALDLGFVADDVLTFNVTSSRDQAGRANYTFYAPLLQHLRALPDVITAGGVYLRPLAFEGVGTDSRALGEGHPIEDLSSWMRFGLPINRETATPGYFDTMRIALRDGRDFTEADRDQAPLVAIISEGAARRLFPGQRAVGRHIAAGGDALGPDGQLPWRTIVGVVSDVRYRGIQDPHFDYYLPYQQHTSLGDPVQQIVVRARANPLDVIAQVRADVRRLDPLAIVDGVTTMTAIVDRAVAPWRLNMVLFALLGVMALAMASVGVYGVVQYAVVERWHELGIRAALGASLPQLTALIVAEGARLALAGLTLGVAAAWALARAMRAILFGIAATDATTFALVIATLAVLVTLASYLPARLASRADPSSLLRSR
jgi:putative ABC transport system permease protein